MFKILLLIKFNGKKSIQKIIYNTNFHIIILRKILFNIKFYRTNHDIILNKYNFVLFKYFIWLIYFTDIFKMSLF